jgi:hypothetical protein
VAPVTIVPLEISDGRNSFYRGISASFKGADFNTASYMAVAFATEFERERFCATLFSSQPFWIEITPNHEKLCSRRSDGNIFDSFGRRPLK